MIGVLQALTDIIAELGNILDRSVQRAEMRLMHRIKTIQKMIALSIAGMFFLLLGVFVIGLGFVLFLMRFFPTDAVLVGVGVVLLNIALILHLVKSSLK